MPKPFQKIWKAVRLHVAVGSISCHKTIIYPIPWFEFSIEESFCLIVLRHMIVLCIPSLNLRRQTILKVLLGAICLWWGHLLQLCVFYGKHWRYCKMFLKCFSSWCSFFCNAKSSSFWIETVSNLRLREIFSYFNPFFAQCKFLSWKR